MNDRIKLLALQAGGVLENGVENGVYGTFILDAGAFDAVQFARLIVAECAKLNLDQSYNLMGVLVDMAEPNAEFDRVCLNTVNHVHAYLGGDALKRYFGFEE